MWHQAMHMQIESGGATKKNGQQQPLKTIADPALNNAHSDATKRKRLECPIVGRDSVLFFQERINSSSKLASNG
jgi:hypothetical protein